MFSMGLAVAFGLLVIMARLNWIWKLRLLSNPTTVDIGVFALLLVLHWGTFSGVMVATIGAVMCSLVLTAGRYFYGYIEAGSYIPGVFNISSKL